MEWPHFYPENCPPAEAKPASGKVYRLVRSDPAQAEDFRTLFEENPRWSKNKPTTTVCKGCGLSVYTDLQDIKQLKDRYKRKFGKYKIAEGELDAKFGMIQNTPAKEESHHTWWVPVRAVPWTVFNIIGESKEQ